MEIKKEIKILSLDRCDLRGCLFPADSKARDLILPLMPPLTW